MNKEDSAELIRLNIELITEFETLRQTVKAIYELLQVEKKAIQARREVKQENNN